MTRRVIQRRPAAPRRTTTRSRRTTPLRRLARSRSTAQGWGRATGAALWVVLLCAIITLGFLWGILLGLADGAKALRRAWDTRARSGPQAQGVRPQEPPRLALPAPPERKALTHRTDQPLPKIHHRP